MPEFITFGETMAVFAPCEAVPLRYCKDYKLRIAGAESNTAIGLAKLGHTAGWISRLGDDELGAYVLSAVRAEGVDTSAVISDKNHRTGLMVKQLSAGETSVFYYRENSAASHYSSIDIDYEYLKSAKLIHLTGITPVLSDECMTACTEIVRFARENGIMLSFDPNIRQRLWGSIDYTEKIAEFMYSSTIVMLGIDEAKKLIGTDDIAEITDKLRSAGVRYIAVKDGAKGAWCANSDELIHIEPYECKCIDPVGAGDGFNAGFISGILKGLPLDVCGKMGAIAGAMATENTGDIEGYPTEAQMNIKLNKTDVIYR